VRFAVFELDLRSGELRKDDARLSLPEQPLQLLKCLLERPGELVTRDELRLALWPGDTFVDFEHGLNAAVKRLRDALGDSADTPRFIKTLPRRGYRFIAPVSNGRLDSSPDREAVPAPAGTEATPEATTGGLQQPQAEPAQPSLAPHRSAVALTVALGITVAAGGVWWGVQRLRARSVTVTAGSPVLRNLTRLTFGPGLDTDVT